MSATNDEERICIAVLRKWSLLLHGEGDLRALSNSQRAGIVDLLAHRNTTGPVQRNWAKAISSCQRKGESKRK